MHSIAYYRCADCGKVTADNENLLSKPSVCSPCCGSLAGARSIWPQAPVYVLFDTVMRQELTLPGSFSVAVVFLYTAIEVLAENRVAELLAGQGAAAEHIEKTLHEYSGLEILAAFLKKNLPAGSVDTPLNAEFTDRLKVLAQLRARVARDSAYRPLPADKETVAWLRERCLGVFAELHNRDLPLKPGSSRSVLVVDDELPVLDYMKKLVERMGAQAYTAATGAEAVQLYLAHKPNIVFLDVSLPDMDGMAILKKIKESDPAAVVYFVTAIGGEAFVHEAERLGAKGYLSKPVESKDLAAIIRSC